MKTSTSRILTTHVGSIPRPESLTTPLRTRLSGQAIDEVEFAARTDEAVTEHSHPNGQAYLSPTDREVATSPWGDGPAYPVQQLVIGVDAERVVEAALFTWSDDEGGFVEVGRYEGAAI